MRDQFNEIIAKLEEKHVPSMQRDAVKAMIEQAAQWEEHLADLPVDKLAEVA